MNDSEFVAAFESLTFPREQWTHRAHIRLAWIYLTQYGFDLALQRTRAGIQAHNKAVMKNREKLDQGYHETLTVAWLRLVNSAIKEQGAYPLSDAFCNDNPHLLQRTLLRCFYSNERIWTMEAKQEFVEPDLAPLP